MKKALIILVLIAMIIVTYLGSGETSSLFYTKESATYLTKVSDIKTIFSVICLIVFLILIFYNFDGRLKKLSLILVFIVWFLSGRKVGVKKFETGMVNYGWYCFQTGSFFLCEKEITLCEKEIAYKTTIEKKHLWRVNVKNEDINETIFIGPIAWNKAIEVLESSIGNGTYTK